MLFRSDRVLGYLDGAEVLIRGSVPDDAAFADGFWVPPTVVAAADTSAPVWREEVFGPVVAVLPFDAEERGVFDLASGHLLSLRETSVQREKRLETAVTFDHDRREAAYAGPKSGGQPQLLQMPDGEPTDLIMGLLQTRAWNLPPGGSREALVLFANDFYELTVRHVGTEEVRTPLGTFRAAVLEPRMERTPPKGMFKRGSTVRVWIADDPRRLPVKFEVEFKIGKGTAVLESHTPPNSPGDATHPRP